jgi:serine phosphatase RsbU (regulator of sigma subunit)/anti-sigma regulatory factor (Ser/Thr protein kinase)/transposase-like protein
MARKLVKEVFMTFPASEDQLEDIRSSVHNILAESSLSNKSINSVLLAIEQACTNVIRHAYLYGPGSIRIKIKLYHDRVIFSIFDKGRKFDFDHSEVPDLDRYVRTGRKGGLGLYLIRKMMDSVEYFTRDDENELRMVKKSDMATMRLLRPPGFSIRIKFALWASLVVFAIVAGVYFYFDNQVKVSTQTGFFRAAANTIGSFVSDIGDKTVMKDPDLTRSAATWLQSNLDYQYVVVTDTTGAIIADPQSSQRFLTQFTENPDYKYNTRLAIPDSSGIRIFHFKQPVKIWNQQVGYAYFGLREMPLLAEIAHARRWTFLISALGLIVGFTAVFVLSNYFVKPIQKLTEGVMRIGEGNLDQTLPVEGADEFSEIARAFNEMTTKFKKAQENVVEQERLQKEMQVAQEIQHALLPRHFPDIEGYDIATVYRAAKDVGGDYFDFVQIDDNTLGVIVADVSGKGVPGSLVMTMIRTALRLESRENYSPTDILARVNRFVTDDVKRGMFITIFFITLDSAKRSISYASAGHNPMILYRKDSDSCYFLNTRGMPLGIALPEGVSFEGSLEFDRVKLKKDDMLVMYTDGITEAMTKIGEQFGNDRFIEFIKANAEFSPEEFTQKLDAELHRFTGGAPQNDDITLVVIKEKIMLDEIVFEKRRRIIEMVEKEGKPLEEACQEMGVSPSTYYKYRRRWQKLGDVGLLNKRLRAESEIKQISYEARKETLLVIRENPEFGTKRIADELAKRGMKDIDQKSLYDELVRMRLNTKKLRLEYVERMGIMTPEMRTQLEKEILKDVEKKEEFDRGEYMETIRKSLDDKKEQLGSTARELVDKLQKMEPVLGDAKLYGDIAAELGKLRGGEDIAKLFENIILKMANISKEKEAARPEPEENVARIVQTPPENLVAPAIQKVQDEEAKTSVEAHPLHDSERPSNEILVDDKVKLVDIDNTNSPIDIVQSASKIEEDGDQKKPEIDWQNYSQRLFEKYRKK